VYYISKGKVKLANRAYASVKNDYTISLDGRCRFLNPMPRRLSHLRWLTGDIEAAQKALHMAVLQL
jgi:hypothetical protein